MKWIAAVAIVIAIAAGVFAFMRDQAADAATAQAAAAKADAQKAQADAAAARAERDAQQKEVAGLKQQAEQLRAEAEVAAKLLEAEKMLGVKLREDLAMTAARLAAAGTRQSQRASDAIPPSLLMMPVRPPPIPVRAVPSLPTAVGAAAPAR